MLDGNRFVRNFLVVWVSGECTINLIVISLVDLDRSGAMLFSFVTLKHPIIIDNSKDQITTKLLVR